MNIFQVARKISKSIGIIYKANFSLSKSSLFKLYYSQVYPYLQYCLIVWGSTYATNLKRICLLQKRIIRIIKKETFNAHTDPLFAEVKILKFEKIYLCQLGKLIYLYQNNLLPKSFENLFLRTSQVHNYNTRHSGLFHIIFCSTNIRKFPVSYQAPKCFNTLSCDVRNASSVSLFQSKLKKILIFLVIASTCIIFLFHLTIEYFYFIAFIIHLQ